MAQKRPLYIIPPECYKEYKEVIIPRTIPDADFAQSDDHIDQLIEDLDWVTRHVEQFEKNEAARKRNNNLTAEQRKKLNKKQRVYRKKNPDKVAQWNANRNQKRRDKREQQVAIQQITPIQVIQMRQAQKIQ